MSELTPHTEIEAMDAQTLKALRGSIKKWERIVAGKGMDKGCENCPLCVRFALGPNESCEGCPVAIRTGKHDCYGTPYIDQWHRVNPWPEDDDGTVSKRGVKTEAHRKAAQAELDFLKSLLPTEAVTDEQQVQK